MLTQKASIKSWEQHSGRLLDTVNNFDVIDCHGCGFAHIVPIPTPQELTEVYREDYYSVEKPLYFRHHREDLSWWNMVNEERYLFLEEHLPAGRRRIIDIGSGPGFFLQLGKARGWETLGIEPSRQAAAHARSLDLEIVNEFLGPENVGGLGTFDAVYMHEVLEHIPEPAAMLGLAGQLLEPDGILCVVVPNDYNPLQELLRRHLDFKPWWVAPPHHINYFTFSSIDAVMDSAHLQVIEKTATFPMELFLLMGDNYVGNDTVGRAMHARRKALEMNLTQGGRGDLKQAFYAGLASRGLGREIVAYAGRRGPNMDKENQ